MPPPADDPNSATEYIFDMTYAEIKEKFKKTTYWINSSQDEKSMVPTVQQLFDLVQNKINFNTFFADPDAFCDEDNCNFNRKILMNLETKAPNIPELKEKYRWVDMVKLLHALI